MLQAWFFEVQVGASAYDVGRGFDNGRSSTCVISTQIWLLKN